MRGTPRFFSAAGRIGVAVGAALALVAAAGACGSSIKVPDQGIIVTGCNPPGYCYVDDCTCERASVAPGGACVVASVCTSEIDRSTCSCPTNSECLEAAQACIGRGPVCAGANAHCVAATGSCNDAGDPPMLIPTPGMPMLEPHCQFVDDVCCTNAPADGGVSD